MEPYNQRDHTHCFDSANPPCGIEGTHRCCLCEKEVPQKGWEEEFDELFEKAPVCKHGFKQGHYICEPHDYPHVLGNRFGPDCETCYPTPRPEVKAFITSVEQLAYDRGLKEGAEGARRAVRVEIQEDLEAFKKHAFENNWSTGERAYWFEKTVEQVLSFPSLRDNL